MILKEKELFDYIKCPAYYDMKYNKMIPINETQSMQKLLDKVALFFYSNLLNKKVCSMGELKAKWDSICQKNKEYIDNRKNLEGINYIVNFARWASENKTVLVDFNSSYNINIDNVSVVGTLLPVSAIQGRKCELIISRFSNKEPFQTSIDKQLKYTMDCYAFKQAYNHDIAAIKVIHFKNNKVFTSNRTQTDYDRLTSTIRGVSNGILAKAFYPSEGIFCSQCPMKPYCKYWC